MSWSELERFVDDLQSCFVKYRRSRKGLTPAARRLYPLCDTVDLELLSIVSLELENRHHERVRRLKRSLWLSSRRGRFVEGIKRWLVQRGSGVPLASG